MSYGSVSEPFLQRVNHPLSNKPERERGRERGVVLFVVADLKNPKTNTKTAGFTQQERDGFTALLGEGFADSFRHLHPTTQAFTYWSYRFNARAKNIGWYV